MRESARPWPELGVRRAGDLAGEPGPILLDTHLWIWVLEGDDDRLRSGAAAVVEQASAAGQLFVSDISFWEIATKAAKGKLLLSSDVDVWLERAGRQPGFQYVPLDRSALISGALLPTDFPGDPGDRLLAATARLHQLALLTADASIIRYASTHPGMRVIDARS